jgi:hypothetical protein
MIVGIAVVVLAAFLSAEARAEDVMDCINRCGKETQARLDTCWNSFNQQTHASEQGYNAAMLLTALTCLRSFTTPLPIVIGGACTPFVTTFVRFLLANYSASADYQICATAAQFHQLGCMRTDCGVVVRPPWAPGKEPPARSIGPWTPILVSVDGSLPALTDVANGVTFDLSGDGPEARVSWTTAATKAGFLALDRDGNGSIDSGTELFGDWTLQPASSEPNGFAALALLDGPDMLGNGDGWITRDDAFFSLLTLWFDANHDGHSQPGELHPLTEFGIDGLGLSYTASTQMDAYGNRFAYWGSVKFNGAARTAAVDVFLQAQTQIPLNYNPMAVPDTSGTPQNTPVVVNVLANDYDREGDAIYLNGLAYAPAHGTAAVQSGNQVQYTPSAGFAGDDEFGYSIRDSKGAVSTGLVRVTVSGEILKTYGLSSDVPIAGDWNGDGVVDVGVFRPSNHTFYLPAIGSYPGATIAFGWPNGEDVPVAGDWNGSGRSQVGIYRRSTGQFFLCANNTAAWPGTYFSFGPITGYGVPVTGDWLNLGKTDVGVFEPTQSKFYLRSGATIPFGTSSDKPVAGDWNGDGFDDVGVFRPGTTGTFLLNDPSRGVVTITYGQTDDRPIAGDWGGIGHDGVGFFRGNVFHLNVVAP